MADFAQDRIDDRFAAEALARRVAEQAALYEFTDRLFRATTRHEIYDAALDAIIRALGCSRASVLLFDDAGKMSFVAWRGLSQAYRDAVAGHSPWRPGDRNAQPVCIDHADAADLPPALKSVLARERIEALAFIPLTVDGAVIGKFMTYYATPHRFDRTEIELAVTIARQLGFRIERLHSEEKRAAAERALKSEREVLSTIIDSAPVMITLFNPETGRLKLNRQYEQLTGWSAEAGNADTLMQLAFPDPEYRAQIATFIEACGPDWMDMTMQTRSGGAIETSWANYRLSDGTRVGIGVEITDRKRVEAHQALLLGETSHRLRNLFAVASSVIDMSARNAQSPGELAEAVHDRLSALTRAHALSHSSNAGHPGKQNPPDEQETTLRVLLAAIFEPYTPAGWVAPFAWTGTDLVLGADAVSALALLLHEFATNAAKHGALSRAGGSVVIDSVVVEGTELAFSWRETGGPSVVGPPATRGFGAYLAERVVNGQFGGRMTREWGSAGLTIRLWLPLDRLIPAASPLVPETQQK
jgi:PAS domain S-box-containing protein